MKPSTALFASVVAICCTINLVTGQINFADGTSQSTAFVGASAGGGTTAVPPGDAFNFTTNGTISDLPDDTGMDLSGTVPAGQELVILQVYTPHYRLYLYSRWPSPDEAINPIDIAYVNGATTNYDRVRVLNFPDGTVVIDEGRQLWGDGSYYDRLLPCSVLGYYRDKT